MMKFRRYSHIEGLLRHYANSFNDEEAASLLNSGITDAESAEAFSRFVWKVVDAMHEDEENKVEVVGSTNNLEMIPDLEYEISNYMCSVGFFNVWSKVSENV